MRVYTSIFLFIVINLGIELVSSAQPHIDLLNVQYIQSPDQGLFNQQKNPTILTYFSAQSTIPFQFKNKKDALILSPQFETWSPTVENINSPFNNQYGIALPISYLKALANDDWTVISTLIIRKNGSELWAENNWQVGGAVLISFKANETLRYRVGIYANQEFFGLFIIPLVGLDWQISKKTNLFGVLPGSLTLEHKLSRKIYAGATFRSITNSYKMPGGFWRLDENRIGIFADYYIAKKFVLNIEAGHSVLRKMRTGENSKQYENWNVNDNLFLKSALVYRLRLR